MAVSTLADALIAEPCVRVHYAAGLYRLFDERLQAIGRCVPNSAHSNSSESSPPDLFNCDHDQGSFFQIPATFAFHASAPVGFVNLDVSRQSLTSWANHSPTELVEPGPCGSVRCQAQYSLQSESARAGLLTGYPPHGSEPRSQRRPGILKDAASGYRSLPSAGRALKEACPDWPCFAMTAFRALKAIRPPQAVKVRAARFLGRKFGFKFSQGSGILFHTQEHYMLVLP
jgi:hypothetical protein